ncbi:MbtH family protein [Paenibacillus ehimensis]|uniref:MbtH family protein n=1 Tax=Paenibacillus ehimensis TaxID=79264 RepID=A0ABT8V1Z4_9BACL|nr:MbtH family protein [Paenibacillus ehimensis]MDO3675435.1 MbtH family protein [Paenibacillus ehimensis]
MTNPFERTDSDYLVLINEEGQHSLWPAFIPVPQGWTAAFGQAAREACLDYIAAHWSDLRPRSLYAGPAYADTKQG